MTYSVYLVEGTVQKGMNFKELFNSKELIERYIKEKYSVLKDLTLEYDGPNMLIVESIQHGFKWELTVERFTLRTKLDGRNIHRVE